LAVVRLKELNAEREQLEEQQRVQATAAAAAEAEAKVKSQAERLPAAAEDKMDPSKDVVIFDKDNAQKQQQVQKPIAVSVKPKGGKKNIRGPILLWVNFFCLAL